MTDQEVLQASEEWFTTALGHIAETGDFAIVTTASIEQLAHLGRARVRLDLAHLAENGADAAGYFAGAAEDASRIQPGFIAYVMRDASARPRWNHVYRQLNVSQYSSIAGPVQWPSEGQFVPFTGYRQLIIDERGRATIAGYPVIRDTTIVDGEAHPVLKGVTGEPVWPIEERPVPRSRVPGEQLSPTQPFPTRPAPYEMQGLTEDDLIDYTPELRQQALEILDGVQTGPLFNPPLHRDNDLGKRGAIWCPGSSGGTNITGPSVADPVTGILYVTSQKGCSSNVLIPGEEADAEESAPTGSTVVDFAPGGGAGVRGPRGLPIYKPPYSRITAIDMNTGEHLWWIPVGDTPDRIRTHPALEGVDIPNTGTGEQAAQMVTASLLFYTGEASDGTPFLYAVDKATGERLGSVEIPAPGRYGMMTYMHDGRQHIVVQVQGSLVALGLPDGEIISSSDEGDG